jgi:hypothetical protein
MAISFVTTALVPFLVLRNPKLPFSKHFSWLCNCIRFTWEVITMGGGLPASLDGTWCCWRSVVSSASSPWSASISIDFSRAKKFRVGTSGFDWNLGSLTPVVDIVDFLALLSASSIDFRFQLLEGRRCINCGLGCFPLPALSLRTSFKSCSTSVYTPYSEPYSCFPCRIWWRFLLVSAMFWTIRVHFGLSPTDAGVHPTSRALVVSTPRTRSMTASVSGCCCMVFS